MSEGEKQQQEAIATDVLTARINAKYREVEALSRSTVGAAIELGGMLAEKKKSLGHGEWLPWLSNHFEGSESHAQRFMRLFDNREKLLANPARVTDMSLRSALKEIAAPGKTKEEGANSESSAEASKAREKEGEDTFENVVKFTK